MQAEKLPIQFSNFEVILISCRVRRVVKVWYIFFYLCHTSEAQFAKHVKLRPVHTSVIPGKTVQRESRKLKPESSLQGRAPTNQNPF